MHKADPCGHSAVVQMELRLNGTRLRVVKVGPDRIYFDSPQVLDTSTGELVMDIDGHERRWKVNLIPETVAERTVRAQFSEPAG